MVRPANLFLYFKSPPNPNLYPKIRDHRLKQRRPWFGNPFEPDDVPSAEYGLTTIGSPPVVEAQTLKFDSEGSELDDTKEYREEVVSGGRENRDIEWVDQIPDWLKLVYDLAWTATFASLTENNKFRETLDSVSYLSFFLMVWWIWVSQLFYNIDFYTDDWFHLGCIFLQLATFGALAATTKDFNVVNYISQSPGESEIQPYDLTTMSPERFKAERLTKVSLQVIALTLALSRILLLIQHVRVLIYAKRTSKSGRIPGQLFLVPVSLVISTILFFGVYVITRRRWGRMPGGAKMKFVLWGVGLLVEIAAHIWRSQIDIKGGIRLRSHGSIVKRLNDITTIIIGEGLNAIAGVFYTMIQVRGISKSAAASVASCAFTVFLLAYLYFEGAAPLRPVRRRAAWIMVHFPWLLSVILLLEGVKNQLLLLSFLDTANHALPSLDRSFYIENSTEFNNTIIPILLQAGLTWNTELQAYRDLNPTEVEVPAFINMTAEDIDNEIYNVWYSRLRLSVILDCYRNFMDNETIPEKISSQITQYLTDYNYTRHDWLPEVIDDTIDTTHWSEIINELLEPTLLNARYIMGLCGLTFISLASLNLIQSWPRDRFQWLSIISRLVMGVIMLLLEMLNIGKVQKYTIWNDSDEYERSGVFKWVDASWVLPTLAIAYGLQFFIDSILVAWAVRHSNEVETSAGKTEKQT